MKFAGHSNCSKQFSDNFVPNSMSLAKKDNKNLNIHRQVKTSNENSSKWAENCHI